jgi:hypothetical protein
MLERDVRRAAMALTESRWLLLWCLWRRQLQLIGHRDDRWDYERGEPVQKNRTMAERGAFPPAAPELEELKALIADAEELFNMSIAEQAAAAFEGEPWPTGKTTHELILAWLERAKKSQT